ncbi:hypothetical protein P3W45_001793 [Vairimorpha bombi]
MNFDDILTTNKIDKFISANKYDSSSVSSFIQYVDAKGIRDFIIYRDILNSITDNKLYTDLALVWNLLVLSVTDKDHFSFVNICDRLSVSLIQKCRGSLYMQDIIKNMVNVSVDLYAKMWEYESTVVIYTTSLFITNSSNLIKNNDVLSKYYGLVSDILLKRNYFYSYLHAVSKTDKNKINKKILEYIKYKNEGNKFSQVLLKMDMSEDIVNKLDYVNDDDGKVDHEKWDFYIKNIGNKISYKDNLVFLSFMAKNNLVYKKEGDQIEILNYKYQSVDSRIHDIVDMYREKKETKQKKVEEKKVVVQKKVEKRSKKKSRERRHNLYNKILKDEKIFFIRIKKDLEDMHKELLSRKKDNVSEYIRPVIKSVSRSWRDDDDADKVVRPIFVKKEEILSDRLIYTYGGNNTQTDSYTPPKNNTYVFKKPYTGPSSDKPCTSPSSDKPCTSPSSDKPYTGPSFNKPCTGPSSDKPYTPPGRNTRQGNILQESLNMILTVETLEGISYKGIVIEVDDYMNIHLKDVDVNYKDNTVQYKKNIFIRGTSIKYFILPPILAKLSS